jgi:hypothetical protein
MSDFAQNTYFNCKDSQMTTRGTPTPGEYLKRAEDFTDMVKKEPAPKYGYTHECPACLGYGGWNLQLNAYGLGKHFRAGCYQCYGWGFVNPDSKSAICVHEFKEISKPAGNRSGIHVDQCAKCGHQQSRDTSD